MTGLLWIRLGGGFESERMAGFDWNVWRNWTGICTQLAKVLDRSAEGLRISLRSDSDWSRPINAAKLKLGRRVYFRTAEIAKVLSGE